MVGPRPGQALPQLRHCLALRETETPGQIKRQRHTAYRFISLQHELVLPEMWIRSLQALVESLWTSKLFIFI